jgi:hypothetical protein
MGWNPTTDGAPPADARQERYIKRRLRELERQAKAAAKLSALESARIEVETFESRLEALLSLHKEQGPAWNWMAVAASLPPVPPIRQRNNEVKAEMSSALTGRDISTKLSDDVASARLVDDEMYRGAVETYEKERIRWADLVALALRIVRGDHDAYIEALSKFNPFAEMAELGSGVACTVHDKYLIECRVNVNGRQAIPTETKSLTSTGKLTVKAMPKARFHELYQDYVCSCVLRVAREAFALLPVTNVIVTAQVETIDPATGNAKDQVVLSAALEREQLEALDFEKLDPSVAIGSVLHRGDFTASRKAGEFRGTTALVPGDVMLTATACNESRIDELVAHVHRLREKLKATNSALIEAVE